jgi:hypothetical protein
VRGRRRRRASGRAGGTYAVDLRCTPYDTTPGGDFCGTEEWQNYFQCDAQPGDECVPAPRPSADPDQTAWCCSFPCTRYSVSDHRCSDGRAAYACTDDEPETAAGLGCVDGVDSFLICC